VISGIAALGILRQSACAIFGEFAVNSKIIVAALAFALTTAAAPAPRPLEICAGIRQVIDAGGGPVPFAALRGAAQRGSDEVIGKLVLAGFPLCHFRPTSKIYTCDRLNLQEASAVALLAETRGKVEACFGKAMTASTRAGGVITNLNLTTGTGPYPKVTVSKIGADIVSVRIEVSGS